MSAAPTPKAQAPQYQHKGFALRLSEPGWVVANRQPDRLELVRQGSQRGDSYGLRVFTFSVPPVGPNQSFARYVAERQIDEEELDPQSVRYLMRSQGAHQIRAMSCIRLHDRKQLGAASAALVETVSVICPHPLNDYLAIDVTLTHDYAPGQEDAALASKLDAMWEQIELNEH